MKGFMNKRRAFSIGAAIIVIFLSCSALADDAHPAAAGRD
jgi:hypothetical protein